MAAAQDARAFRPCRFERGDRAGRWDWEGPVERGGRPVARDDTGAASLRRSARPFVIAIAVEVAMKIVE